jgi:hypothetical protein
MDEFTMPTTIPEQFEWFQSSFRPHFNKWVFKPIDRLVSSDDALIGFILMTCAIDYLSGFWYGESTKGKIHQIYTGFIDKYFPIGRYDSQGLYDSLRNGLVHLFTIKGTKYGLTHNNPKFHLSRASNGQIILDAGSFRDDLVIARDTYFDEVEKHPELLGRLLERYQRDGFLTTGELRIV